MKINNYLLLLFYFFISYVREREQKLEERRARR